MVMLFGSKAVAHAPNEEDVYALMSELERLRSRLGSMGAHLPGKDPSEKGAEVIQVCLDKIGNTLNDAEQLTPNRPR